MDRWNNKSKIELLNKTDDLEKEIGDLLVEANKSWNTILLITHDVHLLNYIKSKTNVNVFKLW